MLLSFLEKGKEEKVKERREGGKEERGGKERKRERKVERGRERKSQDHQKKRCSSLTSDALFIAQIETGSNMY